MIIGGKARLTATAAVSLVAFATLPAQPASAQQLLFDWGGSGTIGGSGREVVAFSPKFGKGEIIVSFGDRKLYFITEPGQAISYPIAIPRDQSRWQGVTNVSQKRVNPSWTPTPVMLAENPRLPRWVPGGHPLNPLGVRGLYLGSSMYRIHGTDAPWTIGTAVSKGCIRLYNQDVLDLYPRVNIGAKVTVTYETFTTGGAVSKGGPVPSKGMTGSQGTGSTFSLFGNQDSPTKAARKRPARTTKARSEAVEPGPTATRTSATDTVAADKSPPVEKGVADKSSAAAAAQD